MKRILFLIMIVSMSLSGYAQNEFSTKFKAVTPKNKGMKIKEVTPPKVNLPEIKPYIPAEIPKNDFIVPKNDVIILGEVYKTSFFTKHFPLKLLRSKITI